MFDEPSDLPRAVLRAELRDGWGIDATAMEYAPVGLGSHHWIVSDVECRWFVTADDLDAKRRTDDDSLATVHDRLAAALSAARTACDRGLSFVIAPRRDRHGAVVRRVLDRYSVAVYPFVDGRSRTWEGDYRSLDERLAVLELVVALHTIEDTTVPHDDLMIPRRADLEAAIGDVMSPQTWGPGPYAEPARHLLARHSSGTLLLLDHFDRLAASVLAQSERMVLTHGEPHPGNTIVVDGAVHLVDWESALLAPPERDLWVVAGADAEVLESYQTSTGRTVEPAGLECYRLWFDLAEIAGYIALFRVAHAAGADVDESWKNLNYFLDPAGRWPSVLGF